MLRPKAIKVEPLENYILAITFDNGERKQFDVKPYIHGSWYSQLKDNAYFNAVKPDGFTIVWLNGQDICPDDLYYSSKAI